MKYLRLFNENMDLAKSIISKKMAAFDKLKGLLSSNMGYIGKFTEFLFEEGIPYENLETLYNDLVYLKKKNRSFDIGKFKYEKLVDKITSQKNEIDIQSLISQFPSEQKSIAKSLISDKRKDYFNLFLQASKKDNLSAFISKISRYKDEDSLINAMKIFGKKAINSKIDIKNFLENSSEGSEVLIDKDDILIIYIKTFKDLKSLASDTSWCILNEYTWGAYTKGRYQYIMYDFTKDEFDPKFKIGMTLTKDSTIYAAHDILDGEGISSVRSLFTSHGIKITDLVDSVREKPKVSKVIKIEQFNKKTSAVKIEELYENTPLEELPKLISKFIDVVISNAGYNGVMPLKKNIFYKMVNKYFADKDVVTMTELSKIDKRLPKLVSSSDYSGILPKKIIDENKPKFDYREQDIVIDGLKIWSDDLISNNIFKHQLFYYPDNWKKDILNKISDRLHKIKENINPQIEEFTTCLIGLDRYLGRNVSTENLKKISNDDRQDYYKIFNLPFEITRFYRLTGDKWIPLVIKKDYIGEESLHLPANYYYCDIPGLLKHLDGYKVEFTSSKENLNSYLKKSTDSLRNKDEYSKKFYSAMDKFTKKSRRGDFTESDDKSIKIRLV